jgi:UDP-N-acetylmuramoyl-tripeptide--D-alanyl-D-alanine ligase
MNIIDFYKLYLNSNKVTIDSRKIEENDIFFAFQEKILTQQLLLKMPYKKVLWP